MTTRRRFLPAFFVLLATVVVYLPVAWLGFVSYDDPLYVTQNRVVRRGLTGEGIVWAFTTGDASHYWHPVTWLSHMLDVQVFGLRPAGHHVTNLVLHCLCAVAVYLVLQRSTKDSGPALFTALLFALHPLRVESVAWIAERKDLLGGLFFWLALMAYVLYSERPSPLRYTAVALLFLLGLLAKPMVVTMPFVLLLLDVWPLRRFARTQESGSDIDEAEWSPARAVLRTASRRTDWRILVLEKAPLFVMGAAVSLITLRMSAATTLPLERLPLTARLANAVTAYVTYLQKLIWPSRLAVIYPHPGMPSMGHLLVSAGVLLSITIAVLWARRRRPYLALGWFWYLGTLVPVIGIVQVGSQALADRYTYVSLTGILVMVSWGLRDLFASIVRRVGATLEGFARGMRWVQVAGASVILIVFSAVTWGQVGYWSNSVTLFGHALDVTKDNCVAHVGLGNALGEMGRLDESSAHFAEALRINPAYGLAHYDLGMNLLKQKHMIESIDHFQKALQLEPDSVEAHLILGFALTRVGRAGEAVEHYKECLRLKPDATLALNNLAWLRATSHESSLRNAAEAVSLAEKACALSEWANARYLSTLAASYAESGRFQDALHAIGSAIDLETKDGHMAAVREYRSQQDHYRRGESLRTEAVLP